MVMIIDRPFEAKYFNTRIFQGFFGGQSGQEKISLFDIGGSDIIDLWLGIEKYTAGLT